MRADDSLSRLQVFIGLITIVGNGSGKETQGGNRQDLEEGLGRTGGVRGLMEPGVLALPATELTTRAQGCIVIR